VRPGKERVDLGRRSTPWRRRGDIREGGGADAQACSRPGARIRLGCTKQRLGCMLVRASGRVAVSLTEWGGAAGAALQMARSSRVALALRGC
jgi:hypothetical protein